MRREIYVNVDELIDLLECIQDATDSKLVTRTVDEVIDIVYFLALMDKNITN